MRSARRDYKRRKTSKEGNPSNGTIVEPQIVAIASSDSDSQAKEEAESVSESEDEDAKISDITNITSKEHRERDDEDEEEEEEEVNNVEDEGEEREEMKNGNQKKKDNEKVPYRFPMNRVQKIVRSGGADDLRVSHEAVFLINKASEKFLELFCEDAYASSVQDNKNYVAYKHLSSAVCKQRRFDFLSDFIPEKLKAEDALEERKLAGI